MMRVLLVVVCGVLLAGCGSGSPGETVAVTSPPPPPSPTSTPEPPAPTTSPLSGRPGGVGTPVVVVKLDNTWNAQPHRNLVAADIVYVEPVEWGLTRLAAVFSSRIPDVVGPVRSARVSDIDMFAPYGDVAFVYSGAQQRLLPRLEAASWIQVSEDLDGPGFYRDYTRASPYNLMAEPQEILESVGPVAAARDMGLVFDGRRVAGGRRARVVTAQWPESRMQFRWKAKTDAYEVWLNGRQARDTSAPWVQRASTVIVQYVKEVESRYGDMFGGVTPRTITIGSGEGLVLRDGRAHEITWKRAKAEDPTSYLDSAGSPIALAPGQVWIVLMDRTRRVVFEQP